MAAVLDALAPYIKNMITDLAKEEASMLLGVSGEITKLEENMESIKAFLADAERKHITDQSVKKWVSKLKDAMYDATDIIDLCQLEADERREAELERGGGMEQNNNQLAACWQPVLACLENHPIVGLITNRGKEKMLDFLGRLFFCLRNPVFAHQIGSRIQELNQRLEAIHKDADRFKFNINLGSNPEPRTKLTDAHQGSNYKMTSSEFNESAIVGTKIDKDTNELAQLLIADDGAHDLKVVSVGGVGGMGKTTLAQKIFNDTSVQEHFRVKIWLTITQHFDEAQLLRNAIEHAGGAHGGSQDKTLLQRTLTNALSTGRFLLVLDDMWSDDAWSHVLSVPIRNASLKQPGNRVLVTTRIEDLAPKMGEFFHQHHATPLEEDDAWSLLKKQLPPNQAVGIDALKDIGTEILKRCDGLPLAIKVVGGVLSTKYASEHDWKAVLESPAWSAAGLPQELDSRLLLSYEDLSPHLKQCFLYCSLIPKGNEIAVNTITAMWISEGLIPSEGAECELEDIANEYHQELIRRNLIEPVRGFALTGYRCTMHDVVRSFAEYMAREESLVVVDDRGASAIHGGDGRRLSVGHTVSSAVEWADLQSRKSLRTLIVYCKIKFQPGDSLCSFSSLRALNIRSADSDMLVASLSKLKHLRFLHLENTDVSMLPEDIHKMKFLQYIYLFGCEKLGHLPSSIVKLEHLRSLDITKSNVSTVPKGFGRLTNLRSLYGFPVHVDDMVDADAGSGWCSLEELAPLSQLRKLTLVGVDNVPVSWMAEKAMISSKSHLSYLTLRYTYSDDFPSGQVLVPVGEDEQLLQLQLSAAKEVLEKLCPPTCVQNVIVEGGYIGCRPPQWMCAPASASFKSLRFLTLEYLLCCTQLPDGLCCLPCLETLVIKVAPAVKSIGPEFQLGLGFPRLRILQLKWLLDWEEWEWNDDHNGAGRVDDDKAAVAMPCLEELAISWCKLSCLPPGLANSHRFALRVLALQAVTNLTHWVVTLEVLDCPELKRISGLSRLHKLIIARCPNLEVLQGVPSLDTFMLDDSTMDTLPAYIQHVSPRYIELACSKKLYDHLAAFPDNSSEWDKISHIEYYKIRCDNIQGSEED